jgi:predicted transcriptional regulator
MFRNKINWAAQSNAMSDKQIVEDLLQRIPEDASLRDIIREIEFVSAVREGLAELDRGERIPLEQVERELPSWIIK